MDPLDPSLDQELEGMPELPPDPIEEAVASLAQTQQQLAKSLEIITQMQAQIGQALGQIAQGMQSVAASIRAAAAPRRRVPIRDHEGKIIEAQDLPMSMQ